MATSQRAGTVPTAPGFPSPPALSPLGCLSPHIALRDARACLGPLPPGPPLIGPSRRLYVGQSFLVPWPLPQAVRRAELPRALAIPQAVHRAELPGPWPSPRLYARQSFPVPWPSRRLYAWQSFPMPFILPGGHCLPPQWTGTDPTGGGHVLADKTGVRVWTQSSCDRKGDLGLPSGTRRA